MSGFDRHEIASKVQQFAVLYIKYSVTRFILMWPYASEDVICTDALTAEKKFSIQPKQFAMFDITLIKNLT